MSSATEEARVEPIGQLDNEQELEPLEGPTEPLRGQDVSPTEVRQTPLSSAGDERSHMPQLAHHRTLVVLGIAAVIIGFVIAFSTARAADKPSVNQASADVANLSPSPIYDPGDFGWQESVTLDSVDYVEVERDTKTCTATGELVYAGDTVSAQQRVAITYVRANNGGWMVDGNASLVKRSWTPLTGADPDRVLAQADILLQKADIQAGIAAAEPSSPTLYSLYRNASCSVASEEFDADELTDIFVLHFDDEGSFVRHSCDLTVELRFRTGSGCWEIASCTADAQALKDDYTPLTGIWAGVFTAQDNDGHGCYQARTTPLTLRVDSITTDSDGIVSLSGSLDGLVHRHGSLSADANETAGDELVEGEVFSGVLERGGYGYVATCTTPESADVALQLVIEFGTDISSSSARATLTTSYERNESFLFVPYQVQGLFADNYTLTKVDDVD